MTQVTHERPNPWDCGHLHCDTVIDCCRSLRRMSIHLTWIQESTNHFDVAIHKPLAKGPVSRVCVNQSIEFGSTSAIRCVFVSITISASQIGVTIYVYILFWYNRPIRTPLGKGLVSRVCVNQSIEFGSISSIRCVFVSITISASQIGVTIYLYILFCYNRPIRRPLGVR